MKSARFGAAGKMSGEVTRLNSHSRAADQLWWGCAWPYDARHVKAWTSMGRVPDRTLGCNEVVRKSGG